MLATYMLVMTARECHLIVHMTARECHLIVHVLKRMAEQSVQEGCLGPMEPAPRNRSNRPAGLDFRLPNSPLVTES